MSIKKSIFRLLPATVSEIAVLTGTSVKKVNSRLHWLKYQGLVRPTKRHGYRAGTRGRAPQIWEKI